VTHKADRSFFRTKRSWSERKDQILGYYLAPYLPKINTQRKPILIVDGFAGPGAFEDGKPGSPLIICQAIEKAKQQNPALPASAALIEVEADLAAELTHRTKTFSFTQVWQGRFLEQLDRVESLAKSHSLFLYLDPFTVEGLEWAALDRVFRFVQAGASVEVLLNFNVDSFCRRGLAALKREAPANDESLPEADWEAAQPAAIDDLNRIVGGEWWQDILREAVPYSERVSKVTARFCDQLRLRFNEVCFHEVREHWRHAVPKYVLVFASRHPDALELMNDAMTKSRETVAAASKESALFEMRPESIVPDQNKLPAIILAEAQRRSTRKLLVLRVIRQAFCAYSSSEIRRSIGALLKSGRLVSSTGKPRINDDVEIWKAPP
jgi:three-Cys-motif partner protein